MSSYIKLIQSIAESILEKVDDRIEKKDSGTKVFKARVVEIPSLAKVKVKIDGVIYTASSNVYCEVNDLVRVCAPCNNWKELYISANLTSGKTLRDIYNGGGGGSGGDDGCEALTNLDIDNIFANL